METIAKILLAFLTTSSAFALAPNEPPNNTSIFTISSVSASGSTHVSGTPVNTNPTSNYNSGNAKYFTGKVTGIIDGDTIVVENESVRLIGINSPERGEDFYEEAKKFLEDLILGEEVELEINGKDKYYRLLAYVYFGNENVNIELVEKCYLSIIKL